MSIEKLWTEVGKILEKGRGYKLRSTLTSKKDIIEAIFQKGNSKIYVYVTNKKLSVQHIRRVRRAMEEHNCGEGLIATIREATPQARKEAESLNIEIIDMKQPLIYIFDHWLVPQHRVLPPEEAKKVIDKYAGGSYQTAYRIFPKILTSDPAVRILKAKPGQIIEIRRVVPPIDELIKKYGEKTGREIYELLKRLIPSREEIYYRIVVEE